jgi:DNA-binding NarL/FixJ family response regulator
MRYPDGTTLIGKGTATSGTVMVLNITEISRGSATRVVERDAPWFWLKCDYPLVAEGLVRVLGDAAKVRSVIPEDTTLPACAVVCSDDENIARIVAEVRTAEVPVVVLGLTKDARSARIALQAGAVGFIHVGMATSQIRRAISVACRGETVVPRDLIAELFQEEAVDLFLLTPRQREILALVSDGFTNAQIAKELFLSEYTIKQHLRAAYKILEVRNRMEAARAFKRAQNHY